MSQRVRFAPSPTGLLHVGALRTALYCHLYAKKHNGQNILRIEDTDRTRYNQDSEEEFITTLKWVGIEFDEGPHTGGPNAPYRQSERKEKGIYAEHINRLLEEGKAYKAFDTPEELNELREYQRINKMPTGYFGGDWRDASPEKVQEEESKGKPYVIRLKIPRDQKFVYQDPIRGRTEWDSNVIDDPVLIKADGMPTYHFAAMVDDHLMGITTVLRGEEWIPSLPKHLCLYEALGWEPPLIVHCPVIVGTDGKKLSKRHGATRVLDYAAQGYLPYPLQNFIALIGWSPGDDREAMPKEELIQAFDIKGIQPSPGRFDLEKLKWMNGLAIREMEPEALLQTILDYIDFPYTAEYHAQTEGVETEEQITRQAVWSSLQAFKEAATKDRALTLNAVKLEQERVETLADFGDACAFFFQDEVIFDQKAKEKAFDSKNDHIQGMFQDLIQRLDTLSNPTPEECEAMVKGWAAENGVEKLGPVVQPIRVALTGKMQGPGLFDLMSVLGPERMKQRFAKALEHVN